MAAVKPLPALRSVSLPILLAVVLLCGGLAGCGRGDRGAPPQITPVPVATRPAAATAPALAPDEAAAFRRMVEDLAAPEMEGRGAATAGIVKARDYIAQRFQELGLPPAFHVATSSRRREPSYLQPFEISLGASVTEQSLAVVGPDDRPLAELRPGEDFNTLGFSRGGAFEGEVVFVGYGIDAPQHGYDSYAGAPARALRGNVALALRYEPQDETGRSLWAKERGHGPWTAAASLISKARAAGDRGAVALLVVDPPSQARGGLKETTHSSAFRTGSIPIIHISAELFEAMLAAAGAADPAAAARLHQRAADAAAAGEGGEPPAPVALEGVVARGRVSVERRSVVLHNVGAVLPGAGALADRALVVGAHYDHLGYGEIGSLADPYQRSEVHHGADDNASGTAGLILLAQRFAQRVRDGTAPANRRALVFVAFSGEERGLLGSRHLVQNLVDLRLDPRRIDAMVNLDMIGRMTRDRLHVMGAGSAEEWEPLLRAAAEARGLELRMGLPMLAVSDHASFHDIRVPAIAFFTGLHPDYHRPSDTPDKINTPGALGVIDVAEDVLLRLWSEPGTLAYSGERATGRQRERDRQAMHGGVRLGVVPDYSDLGGSEGALLSGVAPGTPAAAAGFRPGDRIVGWNDREVLNVEDLSLMLSESKPGDRVRLKVRRGEEELELTATLAER